MIHPVLEIKCRWCCRVRLPPPRQRQATHRCHWIRDRGLGLLTWVILACFCSGVDIQRQTSPSRPVRYEGVREVISFLPLLDREENQTSFSLSLVSPLFIVDNMSATIKMMTAATTAKNIPLSKVIILPAARYRDIKNTRPNATIEAAIAYITLPFFNKD